VLEQSLRDDSGGPGEFRGGLGQSVVLENHEDTPLDFTFWQPRVHHPAQGLFGGKPGAAGLALLNDTRIEGGRWRLEPGDRAVLLTPGGGGFGDPLRREASRVEHDVAEGYVSREKARDEYGVAVGDKRRTNTLRTSLSSRKRAP
jgi:N-methylhydantoinase B